MSALAKASAPVPGSLPKHVRLRNELLADLGAGRLKPGDPLPTEAELTSARNVSRNTVRQALAALENDGLIRRVPGRGTFVHESASLRLKTGLDVFGLIIPDSRTGFYPSLQRGFHDAAGRLNNQVIVCDTSNDPNRQASALLQLMDKQVAGIAIVPTTVNDTPRYHISPLHRCGIPVVFCHRRVEGIQAPLVTFSATGVGRLAAQTLGRQGHRRVAFFSPTRTGLAPRYLEGFRAGLRELRADLLESCVCCDDAVSFTSEHRAWARGRLQEIMKGRTRPTAIFCTFDAEAEGVYFELAAMGLRVPDDVSLVSFGGRWREGALAQRLAAITVDEEELARQAVRVLDEMRRKERPLDDTEEILMPLELTAGETLAAKSAV